MVHRLDKDTSGLIRVAKNDRSHRWLQEYAFACRVRKVYLAPVDGISPTPTGRIEAPIGRDPAHRRKTAVTTLQKGQGSSHRIPDQETHAHHILIEAHPLTGRHQIRLAHGILAVRLLRTSLWKAETQPAPGKTFFSHATRRQLCSRSDGGATFTAPLPADLKKIIQQLRTHGVIEIEMSVIDCVPIR